jgi:hypothetical protein
MGEPSEEDLRRGAAILAEKSESNMLRFAETVKKFSTLVPQDVQLFNEVRWWRGSGWELLRVGSGHWMGWPVGRVAWPPVFARAAASSPAAVFAHVVEEYGGFIVFQNTVTARVLDDRLRGQ